MARIFVLHPAPTRTAVPPRLRIGMRAAQKFVHPQGVLLVGAEFSRPALLSDLLSCNVLVSRDLRQYSLNKKS